ncbi:hypothetical protein HanIR_Chr06g0260421 [Helianthus annuus]|nr:hypothetical protein HanIR_Chr06g0260421 [Helianthus annuus]
MNVQDCKHLQNYTNLVHFKTHLVNNKIIISGLNSPHSHQSHSHRTPRRQDLPIRQYPSASHQWRWRTHLPQEPLPLV